MELTTKQIVQTALLLVICIVSQWMKNTSVYITGSAVNATIILAVMIIGLNSGILISVISPVTAFFIAPSPITMGIPVVIPCIMIGNVLLVMSVWMFKNKIKRGNSNIRLAVGISIGAIIKAIFMGISIVIILLPLYGGDISVPTEKLDILLQTAKITFSITQFITAMIGGCISYIVYLRIRNVEKYRA